VSDIAGQTSEQPTDPTAIGQTILAQVDVDAGKLSEIASWAFEEITKAQSERSNMDAMIVEWERLYEARPREERKTFPWDGAANLVVPVIATAVDSILSRIVNAIFGASDVWSSVAKSGAWVELADPIQKWLNWVGKEILQLKDICQVWFLTAIKHGTGIAKLTWEQQKRNVVYKDASGTLTKESILIHDGPVLRSIHIMDFLCANDAIHTFDLQSCEWVAHRGLYTKKSLNERVASGTFLKDAVDKVINQPRSSTNDLEQEAQTNTGIEISEFKDYEIWELWGSYDVDDDGIPEEIVLDIHLESKSVLRCVYNFYRHQERPFHLIRYMPRDTSIFGIGIAQMLQDIQEEITTIHNQRLDNATLSNTRVFKRRRGCTLGSEELYPGAMLDVDEPDDITDLAMGEQHMSMLQEEMHTGAYGEKRTGISDYSVGRESSAIGSRATATSTLAIIQEGNKRFQMTIGDIRNSLTNIAHQIIMLYQQFAPDNKVMYEMFDDKQKQIVQQYLKLPAELSRANVLIDTPAISEVYNKDVQRQTLLTLMGVMKQVYDGMIQGFMAALSPQAPQPVKELAAQGAKAASEIWLKVLEAFDFSDAETFVPDVDKMLGLAAGLEGMNANPQLQPGGSQGGLGEGQPGNVGPMVGGPQGPGAAMGSMLNALAGSQPPGGAIPGAGQAQNAAPVPQGT
jgi:hypothetical protein